MLPGSPTNSFLADEVASTCPLLTPSPPTNDLINPLPEPEQPSFTIGEELASKLQHVKDDDKEGGDSASSSSSALAEPVCTQLLNHRHNTYHHISKDEISSTQETNGKVQPLQLTFKKPPVDYFFMTWNWPLIRKIALWIFLSGLVAMMALVVAMVSSLPKTCNPPTLWYQGNVIYEIFPASFTDSNEDGIGDLKGISIRADYLLSLGIKGVRLNSIFSSEHYPEHYDNVTSLTELEKELGTMHDFRLLVDALHLRNISLILDLPLWPNVEKLKGDTIEVHEFKEIEYNSPSVEFLRSASLVKEDDHDEVTKALYHWLEHKVDGFYLKGLEHHLNDVHFVASIRRWKRVLGPDRPIIVSYNVIKNAPKGILNTILANVDLIDVHLDMEDGTDNFSKQIESYLNSTLYSKGSMPWIQWNLGNLNTPRLANRLYHSNATLGVTLLQLLLPGTVSIFYGDEIGLKQITDPHDDKKDISHLHNLAPMIWNNTKMQFTRTGVIPWMHGLPTQANFDQLELISKMIVLRSKSPSIYINSVTKDGVTKANAEIKRFIESDLMVIQRWYPRRKNFVVVSNLGAVHREGDLSRSLYSGDVVVGPTADSRPESVSFKSISLWPGESIVIALD
ncbi:alpha-amylase family member [Holotrichia oblita]|uniref:Alpha-amylase family member n=1 Tax=Holotrichia oblita TaxID=644536 RepID=A0ACB9T1D8_HOLOL|nr:alpha-amylase family member [Holotrichia oblita]